MSDETLSGIPLSIEHIFPEALGGKTTRDNLWLTCRPCNEIKGTQTEAVDPETGEPAPIFHPRRQVWEDHFTWSEDGTNLIGKTAEGRATVILIPKNWTTN
ncbi:MAG TPA: HNH endonuclease [Anaerolineales bacterium]|nr:HNH endonuclease [Anaerolineales bacterium]